MVFVCVYIYVSGASLGPVNKQKRHQIPRTRVTDGCHLPLECWELNATLQEQPATSTAEPSLQPPTKYF